MVLSRVRNPFDNVQEELEEMKIAASQDENQRQISISEVMAVGSIRKALIVGCLLQAFQQFCGINTVMYYSATIIQMAGMENESTAIWLASLTAFINMICCFAGLYFIDSRGNFRDQESLN